MNSSLGYSRDASPRPALRARGAGGSTVDERELRGLASREEPRGNDASAPERRVACAVVDGSVVSLHRRGCEC